MGFEYVKELPSPQVVKELIPVNEELANIKRERDKEIADIITGDSSKFLAIVGPCSADHEDPVCDYACRLAKVQEKIKDKVLIVPRVYTNKPRTTGEGYKGMLHQPDPEKKPDMLAGIMAIRKMHIRVMNETHLTPADEMLYPENYEFFIGYFVIRCCGSTFGRGSAAQTYCKRNGHSCRNEESYKR